MQTLRRQCVRYFNGSYQQTGTLWELRFKSCGVNLAPHEIYKRLGSTVKLRAAVYRASFAVQLTRHDADEIRAASNAGMALGNLRFQQ